MDVMCFNFDRILDSIQKKNHFLSTMVQPRHKVAFILDLVYRICKKIPRDSKGDRWTAQELFQLIAGKPDRFLSTLKDVDLMGLLLSQLIESCAHLLWPGESSSDIAELLGSEMALSSFPAIALDALQPLLSFIESGKATVTPTIRTKLLASKLSLSLFSAQAASVQ
ncbi:hypothetical protein CBR_g7987 [Chara braunii]|uniref:Uncharacterized protein n=1 Tax=Chara braunii TaxID=69332 RepID=A0A388KL18_CHABU|nr:hypothetical protein CBR_g7987 [Chara braunii]|eukprot:GBG70688.1 hypothetical protein CBR_g7987 [Chara braunii]